MSDLKKFIRRRFGRRQLAAELSPGVDGALVKYDRERASHFPGVSGALAKVIGSDEFMDELSRKIGRPRQNESRQEFIERARKILATQLRDWFRNK